MSGERFRRLRAKANKLIVENASLRMADALVEIGIAYNLPGGARHILRSVALALGKRLPSFVDDGRYLTVGDETKETPIS